MNTKRAFEIWSTFEADYSCIMKKLRVLSVKLIVDSMEDIVDSFLLLSQNLTCLQLSSCFSERIASAIANYCPNLTVLDISNGNEKLVNDKCLDFLSQNKKMEYFIFTTVPDQFDYEDKLHITTDGLAKLILNCPLLKRCDVPTDLIADTLLLIFRTNHNCGPINLYCLYLDFDLINKQILPEICMLTSQFCTDLAISIRETWQEEIFVQLGTMHKLERLKLIIHGNRGLVLVPEFRICGENLRCLFLALPYFNKEYLDQIQMCCPNLRILILRSGDQHSTGSKDDDWQYESGRCIESLDKLEVNCYLDINSFIYLSRLTMNLRYLYLTDLYMNCHDLKIALEAIVGKGCWQRLELLFLPQIFTDGASFDIDFISRIIIKLPSLSLLAINALPMSKSEVASHLSALCSKVRLVDYIDYSSPSDYQEFKFPKFDDH